VINERPDYRTGPHIYGGSAHEGTKGPAPGRRRRLRRGRKLLRQVVTKQPVTEVAVVGTKKAPTRQCDPNYSGCVPIASDVDCAGGSGNGPAYVSGPIQVTGSDIYDLDSDNDGIACE
jgi:hypothetical protein